MSLDTPAAPRARDPQSNSRIALALALGAILRLWGLDVHSLWFDEGCTLFVAQSDDILATLQRDRHPPLTYYFFRAWIEIFGEDDARMRLLPALVSCAALALFAALCGLWSRGTARTLAVALCALSPFHIWIAQEVRMYAFVELFSVGALLACASFVERASRPKAALILAGCALSAGSHYFGGLVIPVVIAVAFMALRSGRVSRRDFALAAGAALAGGALWIPWLAGSLRNQLNAPWGFQAGDGLRSLIELPVRQLLTEASAFGAWSPFGYAVAAAMLLGVASFMLRVARRREFSDLCIALTFALPIVVALSLALVGPANFTPRYLMVGAAATPMIVAIGLSEVPWRSLRVLLVALVLSGSLALALVHKQANLRQDYRSACSDVQANWQPGDVLVPIHAAEWGYAKALLAHYLRGRPEIVAGLRPQEEVLGLVQSQPRKAQRVHLVHLHAGYTSAMLKAFQSSRRPVRQSEDRFRVQYFLLE